MKTILSWLFLAIIIGGVSYTTYDRYQQLARTQAYDLALMQIKRDFSNQVQPLVYLGNDDYKRQINIVTMRYFNSLRDLAQKFSDLYRVPSKSPEDIPEAQRAAREERATLTNQLFEELSQGKYQPLYSNADKSFRFDITQIQADTHVKISFVHWGARTAVNYKTVAANIQTDNKRDKHQMIAENQAPTLVFEPEHWLKEFIPDVQIGYYEFPKFPSEAKTVDLQFDFELITPGGTALPVSAHFASIPVGDTWKVATGEKWEEQTTVTSTQH
jgi:hypothetical protein